MWSDIYSISVSSDDSFRSLKPVSEDDADWDPELIVMLLLSSFTTSSSMTFVEDFPVTRISGMWYTGDRQMSVWSRGVSWSCTSHTVPLLCCVEFYRMLYLLPSLH